MSNKRPGRVIRITKEVEDKLKRCMQDDDTYDDVLRRYLGLRGRSHNFSKWQNLFADEIKAAVKPLSKREKKKLYRKHLETLKPKQYFIIHNNGAPLAYVSLPEAKGIAVMNAVQLGRKMAEKVIKVQEIP